MSSGADRPTEPSYVRLEEEDNQEGMEAAAAAPAPAHVADIVLGDVELVTLGEELGETPVVAAAADEEQAPENEQGGDMAALVQLLSAPDASVESIVLALQEANPAPGSMSAVVLDLLNSGIDVPDILDQLVGPQAPAPADEPEAAAETERFLSVDEARGNEDEDDEDDEDDAAAPVARGRGARRSRGRGRHRGTRPRRRRPQ